MADSSLIFNILAVDKASSVIGKLGGNWGKLALGIAAAAGAIAIKTTEMAANFQSQMTRLVTSAGETQSGLKVVQNGVLNLAGQVGDSTTELNRALYTIESGGQHGAAGLIVLKAAAQGAKAENADLTTVADAVTSVLQDYHLKASDAATVTSKLVAAVGAGKTTFQELAGSLSSVLPIASAAHISLSDVTGALASMTVHGMSADQASQNLADTIRHMQAPTQVQTKELGQLGIQSSDLSAMLGKKGITGTLQFLSTTILSKMGPAGKVLLGTFTQSKQAAADVKAMVASMPPTMQNLAKEFMANKITSKDWTASLKGLSPEQANQMRQFATLQGRVSGFSDALKTGSPAAQSYTAALKAATGDATGLNTALMLTGENTGYVTNAVNTVAGATTEAGNNVKGWGDVQKTFNQKMAEAKGTVEALGIRIGLALLPAAQKILGVIMALVTWFTKHTTTAKILGIVIGALATGMLLYKGYMLATAAAAKVAAAGQWLLNLAMDANPIGLIIIAVLALVAIFAYLWMHSAAFRKFWIGLWDGIKGAALAVGHWFAGPFTHFFEAAYHDVLKAGKAVGHWFASTLPGYFVTAWHAVENGLKTAYNWISGKFTSLVNFVKGIPHKISNAARGMFDGITNAFRGMINWIIRAWDSLHFSIPSIDTHIPGIGSIGGFTVRVPQMPQLATGGTISQGGLALVGEKGPEVVALPTAAHVYPSGRGPGNGQTVICLHMSATTQAIVKDISAYVRGNYNGNVQLALQGH